MKKKEAIELLAAELESAKIPDNSHFWEIFLIRARTSIRNHIEEELDGKKSNRGKGDVSRQKKAAERRGPGRFSAEKEKCTEKIMTLLSKAGDKGLSRMEVAKKLGYSEENASDLAKVSRYLKDLVGKKRAKSTGALRFTRYFAKK